MEVFWQEGTEEKEPSISGKEVLEFLACGVELHAAADENPAGQDTLLCLPASSP